MLENKKILIVEDDLQIIRSYQFKFAEMKEVSQALVKYAVNGQEARSLIESDKPDLIYLDLALGETTKPEGLDILKQYARMYNIIVISGFDEHADACLAIGAKLYFTKPVDFLKMLEMGEFLLK